MSHKSETPDGKFVGATLLLAVHLVRSDGICRAHSAPRLMQNTFATASHGNRYKQGRAGAWAPQRHGAGGWGQAPHGDHLLVALVVVVGGDHDLVARNELEGRVGVFQEARPDLRPLATGAAASERACGLKTAIAGSHHSTLVIAVKFPTQLDRQMWPTSLLCSFCSQAYST